MQHIMLFPAGNCFDMKVIQLAILLVYSELFLSSLVCLFFNKYL